MANPTTNYGWPMPTATDLVTDLPADFAAFGQPVDTSLKALNPETTLGDIAYRSATSNTNTRLGIGTSGQVLAVSGGGVPAWTTTADVTPLTTKGDLFTFTTVDARIGVGANNTVLTADSAEASGLKWATPSSTATSYTLLNSGGTALTGAAIITISSISGKNSLFVTIIGCSSASASSNFAIRLNADTTNYSYFNGVMLAPDTVTEDSAATTNRMYIGAMSANAASVLAGYCEIDGCNSSGIKVMAHSTGASAAGGASAQLNTGGATYSGTSTISSISILSDTGNFDAGTIYVYGA